MKIAAAHSERFCRLRRAPCARGRTEYFFPQGEKGIKERASDFHLGGDHLDERRAERTDNALPRAAGREKFIRQDTEEPVKALRRKKRNGSAEGKRLKEQGRFACKVHPAIGVRLARRAIAVPLSGAKQKRGMRGGTDPFAVHLEEGGRLDEQQKIVRVPLLPQDAKVRPVRSLPDAQYVHPILPDHNRYNNRSIFQYHTPLYFACQGDMIALLF